MTLLSVEVAFNPRDLESAVLSLFLQGRDQVGVVPDAVGVLSRRSDFAVTRVCLQLKPHRFE